MSRAYLVTCLTCRYHLHTEPRRFPTPLLLRAADCWLFGHEMVFDVTGDPIVEDAGAIHRRFLQFQGRGC